MAPSGVAAISYNASNPKRIQDNVASVVSLGDRTGFFAPVPEQTGS